MAEISSLKIKLASADKDRRDLDERLRITQRQVKEYDSKLALKDAEISELRQRLLRNGTVVSPDTNEYEVEKLKKAVETLMFANSEKDKRIEELRKMLRRYKKIEEMVIQAQGKKALDEMMINAEDDTSSTSSTTPSLGDGAHRDLQEDKYDRHHPSATSTPVHSYMDNSNFNTPPSTIVSSTPRRTPGIQRSNSAEDVTPTNQKKKQVTNNNHHEGFEGRGNQNFGTLPKDRVQSGSDIDQAEARKSRGGFSAIGKSLLRVKASKRSTSAPNLGDGNSTTKNVPVSR